MRKNKFIKVESEIDDIAEELYKQGLSITQISRQLKIDRGCLSKRLKKRGICIINNNNKKAINSNFFNIIDSEEKAYWLGVLMADGSINDKNHIELCLKDKEHIEKFKTSLNSDHKITKKVVKDKEYFRLSFADDQIGKSLKKLGCIPNKTFNMELPNISKDLIRHYVRGFFDGDGSISVNTKQWNSQVSFVSGCENFLIDLCDLLNKEIDLNTKLYVRRTNTCYAIYLFNKEDKQKILDYMYKDSNIYLDRKYNKYLDFCRLKSKKS